MLRDQADDAAVLPARAFPQISARPMPDTLAARTARARGMRRPMGGCRERPSPYQTGWHQWHTTNRRLRSSANGTAIWSSRSPTWPGR